MKKAKSAMGKMRPPRPPTEARKPPPSGAPGVAEKGTSFFRSRSMSVLCADGSTAATWREEGQAGRAADEDAADKG